MTRRGQGNHRKIPPSGCCETDLWLGLHLRRKDLGMGQYEIQTWHPMASTLDNKHLICAAVYQVFASFLEVHQCTISVPGLWSIARIAWGWKRSRLRGDAVFVLDGEFGAWLCVTIHGFMLLHVASSLICFRYFQMLAVYSVSSMSQAQNWKKALLWHPRHGFRIELPHVTTEESVDIYSRFPWPILTVYSFVAFCGPYSESLTVKSLKSACWSCISATMAPLQVYLEYAWHIVERNRTLHCHHHSEHQRYGSADGSSLSGQVAFNTKAGACTTTRWFWL